MISWPGCSDFLDSPMVVLQPHSDDKANTHLHIPQNLKLFDIEMMTYVLVMKLHFLWHALLLLSRNCLCTGNRLIPALHKNDVPIFCNLLTLPECRLTIKLIMKLN